MSMIRRMVEKNLELNIDGRKEQLIYESGEIKKDSETNEGYEAEIEEEEELGEDEEDLKERVEEEKKTNVIGEGEKVEETMGKIRLADEEKEGERGKIDRKGKLEEGESDQKQQKQRRRQSAGEALSQGPDNQTLLRLLEQGEQVNKIQIFLKCKIFIDPLTNLFSREKYLFFLAPFDVPLRASARPRHHGRAVTVRQASLLCR